MTEAQAIQKELFESCFQLEIYGVRYVADCIREPFIGEFYTYGKSPAWFEMKHDSDHHLDLKTVVLRKAKVTYSPNLIETGEKRMTAIGGKTGGIADKVPKQEEVTAIFEPYELPRLQEVAWWLGNNGQRLVETDVIRKPRTGEYYLDKNDLRRLQMEDFLEEESIILRPANLQMAMDNTLVIETGELREPVLGDYTMSEDNRIRECFSEDEEATKIYEKALSSQIPLAGENITWWEYEGERWVSGYINSRINAGSIYVNFDGALELTETNLELPYFTNILRKAKIGIQNSDLKLIETGEFRKIGNEYYIDETSDCFWRSVVSTVALYPVLEPYQ